MKFTSDLNAVIKDARKMALDLHRSSVDLDIFFDCFIKNLSLSCSILLRKLDLEEDLLIQSSIEIRKKRSTKLVGSELNKDVAKLFKNCSDSAVELFDLDYIPPEIVLLNLFNPETSPKAIQKASRPDSFSNIVEEITLFIQDSFDEQDSDKEIDFTFDDMDLNLIDMFEDNQILSQFAENLNLKAAQKGFGDIVDFDDKISEISTVLCRKKKPNAILVGPAGTGKTSLVEGLVSKIVDGDVPELIANKVIYSLSLSSMVAGTQYRGQFEERLEQFVNEVKKYSNIILFIDEIHTLVGAGGSMENSLEASNILKPELARGTISCIGATTINEYTNTIKKDSALDRRFERVMIKEPSKHQMREILPTITSYYEDFHGVEYTEEFVESIVDFCEKYTPNKYYPDKAIDVVDHCGAQAKINYWNLDPEIKSLQSEIIDNLETGDPYKDLMDYMNEKLEGWSDKMLEESPKVTMSHLKEFYVKKQNPLNKTDILESLTSHLSKTFVGHRKIIRQLKEEITISNYGFKNKKLASPSIFCFSGGSSTGKTYLCDLIKNNLEKSGANILSYNGVHFSDQFAPYKIISERNNNTSLCEKVSMNPNTVIIIDDFHKVHESAKTLFAQIFKEGRLQLNNGDVADFSNCKIFLTSSLVESKAMGFQSGEENPESVVFSDLKQYFDCELFLHKLQGIDIRRVLWQKLKEIRSCLKTSGVYLKYDFNFIKGFTSNIASLKDLESKLEKDLNKFMSNELLKGTDTVELKSSISS